MNNYQWGYVGDGNCPSCYHHSELWVVSAPVDDMQIAKCVYCLNKSIETLGYRGDEGSKNLAFLNPVINQSIYGEPKPWCIACGNMFGDDSETITLPDSNGTEFVIHESCQIFCDWCESVHINFNHRFSFRMTRYRELDTPNFVAMVFHTSVDDETFCETCLDNSEYLYCDNCDHYEHCDSITSYGSGNYCNGCYQDNVYSCDDCDEEYWAEDGHDCESGYIKPWDYKPSPTFYHVRGENPTYYLGLELEVENTRDEWSTFGMAEIVQDNYLGERAYLKHDGSISDGFEIVTHPHTLQAMKQDFNWNVLDKLRDNGFRSWNASNSSCGIHVHVSRTAFGQNDRRRVADHKRDAHILRFMKLIYDNQRQVERLAGRSSSRWATFGDKGQLVSKVKHGNQENGRYSAVNTDNYNTLEVRVFKGSLKKERVLSALEFVTASVEYTRDLKVTGSNNALSWSKFLAYVVANEDIYPNLLSKISESLATETINN